METAPPPGPVPDQASEPAPPGPPAATGAGEGGGTRGVVGVRVSGRVRTALFDCGALDLEVGTRILVQDEQGTEVGEVVQPTTRARAACGFGCMRTAVRVAGEEDLAALRRRASQEDEARDFCRERIAARQMAMKLVRVEQAPDTRKLTFLFTAEGRVDFRELVRDLAQRLRCRIEMRQIGVRDEAGLRGGYGDCGRSLCCSTFLKGFAPISIRMAREQNLSLNPSKISGMCGRLKCCLRYEYQGAGSDAAGHEDETPPRVENGAPAHPTSLR